MCMKKLFFLFLVCSIMLFCQEIQILPSISHLGKIADTKPVKCTFEIYNPSQKTLEISRIHSFCSCNVATLESKEILPGERKKLEITFNPYGRNSGYLRWEVQIFHNLSSYPLFATFDVTVLKDHYLSHPSLYLGEFSQGKQQEAKVWISPRDFPDFTIQNIDFQLNQEKEKCFDVVYEKEMYDGFYPAPRLAYCLKIIAKKDIPAGVIQGNILVKSNFSEKPVIEIPLFAKVSGEISINRNSLNMGIIHKKKSLEKTFMVYAVDESKPFEIKKIESSLSFLSLELETLAEGRYYQIHVKPNLGENFHPGEFRGQIHIHTSNSRQPLLVLPVQGYIPASQ